MMSLDESPKFRVEHENFTERRRFGSLDGIRCICIVAVIWHHCPGLSGIFGTASTRGFLGVDMFFVLSGFLITTLLIRERERFGRISLRAFWARRCLRIFPIYYAMLFALSAVYLLKGDDPDSGKFFAALPWNALYLSNWTHENGPNLAPLWSLATEEQFYLIWPLVEAFARKWVRRALLGLLVVLNVLFAMRIGFGLLPENIADYLAGLNIGQTTFLPILLGVLLAHAANNPASFRLLNSACGHRFSSIVWFGILAVLVSTGPQDIQGIWRSAIQVAMTLVIASCVLRASHVLSGPLDLRPVRLIGEVSYGMYLFHMWVIDLVRRVEGRFAEDGGLSPIMFFLIVTALTFAISFASFRLFEQPILRFKKRFDRVGLARPEPVVRDPV
jgi:peptidoglycan/LPS O-acetylase OafA/YrhL